MVKSAYSELETLLNRGTIPQAIIEGHIAKGAVGVQGKYKIVVNSSDHQPPHIHISENNHQIAKYSLETGEPLRSNSRLLDQIAGDWLRRDNNREKALAEWRRFHGDRK